MDHELNEHTGHASFVAPDQLAATEKRKQFLDAIVRNRPELGKSLEGILVNPTVAEALKRAARKDAQTLANDFANDLRESFGDLGDTCPTSIDTLDFRTNVPEDLGRKGTTGMARDYLMQRLTGTVNIADFALIMTLPPDLQRSFEREADKLATFLVSLKRAVGESSDSEVAA